MQTVGDTNSIITLLDSIREMASQIFTCLEEGAGEGVSTVYTAIHKAKAWYTSAKRFVQHLMKEYPLYCDLLLPFVAGICQVSEFCANILLSLVIVIRLVILRY